MGLGQVLHKNKKLARKRGSLNYMAPEVLWKNYNHKCDIWSCGVILYILITGKFPFNALKKTEGKVDFDKEAITKKILKGKADFTDPLISSMSAEALDILKLMLVYDFEKRPEAQELLTHPWFESTFERVERKNGKYLYQIFTFCNSCRLHYLIYLIQVYHILSHIWIYLICLLSRIL